MNLVSVYARDGRATWYVAYFCPRRLKRVNESSGFRLDDPQGKRKARDYATERAAAGAIARVSASVEGWDAWVEAWINDTYRRRVLTRERYLGAWKWLRHYLAERRITRPRTLTYADVLAYVDWRTAQQKPSGRTVARNTALLDVRVLSQTMREAIRRGFATTNPAERMRLSRDPAREKPEITDDEIAKIRAALAQHDRPEWMRICFEIALHQGCRLRETQVELRDIDLQRDTITFRAKGGKVFATRLHSGIKPLIQQLTKHGAFRTCTLPPRPSVEWRHFFREIGLPHVCFHCTRVTCVTRMARAGVPVQQAMAYVGHASELVHRIYQRLKAPDLTACVAALQFSAPALPAAPESRDNEPPRNPDAPASTRAPAEELSSDRRKSRAPLSSRRK